MDLQTAHRKALKMLDVDFPSVKFPRTCPFTPEEIVGDAVMNELGKAN
jgi:hypothetical protein